MTKHTALIVGMHFRPPAKALLQILPSKAKLYLVPEGAFGTEPNPYDPNAISVWVESNQIPPSQHTTLDSLVAGNGLSTEEILKQSAWQLGYIPKEIAAQVRQEVIASCETWKATSILGELGFSLEAKPQVTFFTGEEVLKLEEEGEEIWDEDESED